MPTGDDTAVKADLKFGEWSAGDHCRAVYQDDGVEYEATIVSVEADVEGNRYATVRLVLYKMNLNVIDYIRITLD